MSQFLKAKGWGKNEDERYSQREEEWVGKPRVPQSVDPGEISYTAQSCSSSREEEPRSGRGGQPHPGQQELSIQHFRCWLGVTLLGQGGGAAVKEAWELNTTSVLGRSLGLEKMPGVRWWPWEAMCFSGKPAAGNEPKFIQTALATAKEQSGEMHTSLSMGGVGWWVFYFQGYGILAQHLCHSHLCSVFATNIFTT